MDSKDAIALLGDDPNEKIVQRAAERNRAIGVLQHHDAITGTAK